MRNTYITPLVEVYEMKMSQCLMSMSEDTNGASGMDSGRFRARRYDFEDEE